MAVKGVVYFTAIVAWGDPKILSHSHDHIRRWRLQKLTDIGFGGESSIR